MGTNQPPAVGDDVEVKAFGRYRTGTVLALSPTGKRVQVRHWMPGNGPYRVAWFPADRVSPDTTVKRPQAAPEPAAQPARYKADGTGVTHCVCWYERQPDGTYDRVSTEDDCPDHNPTDWED